MVALVKGRELGLRRHFYREDTVAICYHRLRLVVSWGHMCHDSIPTVHAGSSEYEYEYECTWHWPIQITTLYSM